MFSELGMKPLKDEGKRLEYACPPKNPLGLKCNSVDLYFENDSLAIVAIVVYNDLEDNPFSIGARANDLKYYTADTWLRLYSVLGEPPQENFNSTVKSSLGPIDQHTVYWSLDAAATNSSPSTAQKVVGRNLKEVVGLTTSGNPSLAFALLVRFETKGVESDQ